MSHLQSFSTQTSAATEASEFSSHRLKPPFDPEPALNAAERQWTTPDSVFTRWTEAETNNFIITQFPCCFIDLFMNCLVLKCSILCFIIRDSTLYRKLDFPFPETEKWFNLFFHFRWQTTLNVNYCHHLVRSVLGWMDRVFGSTLSSTLSG